MESQFVYYTIDGIRCESLIQDHSAQDYRILGFDFMEPVDKHAEDLPFGWGLDCKPAFEAANWHVEGSWWAAAMAQHQEDTEYERGAHVDRCVEDDLVRKHEGA